jgi:hypothetical protein
MVFESVPRTVQPKVGQSVVWMAGEMEMTREQALENQMAIELGCYWG